MDKKRWIIFAVGVALLFGGMYAYSKMQQASLPQSDGSSNFYGKKDSKVKLVEFVDFQCEACYAYYPIVKKIKEKYKDRVSFQIRYFPISSSHRYSRVATAYAESAARQGKFFAMHDKIFEGQKTWETSSNAASEYFDVYAREIGLDMTQLKKDLESSSVTATINADVQAAKAAGAQGTPTFVLNGQRIENPQQTEAAFSQLLDKALADAQAK